MSSHQYVCHFVMVFICLIAMNCSSKADKSLESETLPDPYSAGWKGEKVCEIIEENDHVRILKCTFAPGVGHEKHYHDPHTGYTLAGGRFRITNEEGTREVNVPTGTHFSNTERTTHEVLNIGETTASFLIIEYL